MIEVATLWMKRIATCAAVALVLVCGRAARAQIKVSGADCFTVAFTGGTQRQMTWIDVKTQKVAVVPADGYMGSGEDMLSTGHEAEIGRPVYVDKGAHEAADDLKITHLYNPKTGEEYELIACPPPGERKPVQYQTPNPPSTTYPGWHPVPMDTTPGPPPG